MIKNVKVMARKIKSNKGGQEAMGKEEGVEPGE